MSRNLSAAARIVGRNLRSTSTPDGFRRGRRLPEELTLPTPDDTVGDAIFTPAPMAEVEDKWTHLAVAIETVEQHPLVKEYGFAPDSLITDVGSDHPVAMGFEVLTITEAACRAVNELASLTNDREVAKVLGWTGELPKQIKGFGADRLFSHADAIQARIAEIRAQREAARSGGIQPRTSLKRDAAPAKPLPALPTEKPVDSDWLGRVETTAGLAYHCTCGCKATVLEATAVVPPFEVMRDRQGSRVSGKDMWRHAFAPRCIRTWGRGFSLIESQKSAFKAQQEAARRQPRPAPRPTPVYRPSVSKTERDRLKALVKGGRMTAEEYELKTGYRL